MKHNYARRHSKKSIVSTSADVLSGMILSATLTDENFALCHGRTAKTLNTKSF
jgi:hypothetical protein